MLSRIFGSSQEKDENTMNENLMDSFEGLMKSIEETVKGINEGDEKAIEKASKYLNSFISDKRFVQLLISLARHYKREELSILVLNICATLANKSNACTVLKNSELLSDVSKVCAKHFHKVIKNDTIKSSVPLGINEDQEDIESSFDYLEMVLSETDEETLRGNFGSPKE